MTTYKHLLVPVDESPMSYAAAEQALSLAKDLNCPVTIMSVIAVDPFVGVDFYKVAPAIPITSCRLNKMHKIVWLKFNNLLAVKVFR